MFVVRSMDKEMFQSDEHLVTMSKTVSYTTAVKRGEAAWKHAYMQSGSYQ